MGCGASQKPAAAQSLPQGESSAPAAARTSTPPQLDAPEEAEAEREDACFEAPILAQKLPAEQERLETASSLPAAEEEEPGAGASHWEPSTEPRHQEEAAVLESPAVARQPANAEIAQAPTTQPLGAPSGSVPLRLDHTDQASTPNFEPEPVPIHRASPGRLYEPGPGDYGDDEDPVYLVDEQEDFLGPDLLEEVQAILKDIEKDLLNGPGFTPSPSFRPMNRGGLGDTLRSNVAVATFDGIDISDEDLMDEILQELS